MIIGNHNINCDGVYVIAEIGNNHNGSLKELVDCAFDAGANCVKFQIRNLKTLYRQNSIDRKGEDLSAEYTLDLLNKFELSKSDHLDIRQYVADKGMTYLCTPWDIESLKILETFNVPAYKVASADFTNLPLIEAILKTDKPLILSTGMSSEDEINQVVSFLKRWENDFALLHCNSTYPAPFEDLNLKFIKKLEKIHNLVGYSGHERGIAVSLAAVGLGAKIIERHITLSRTMEGPDHAASLEPDQFKNLVSGIREVEKSLGNGNSKQISQGEMINRENLAKSIVAAETLKAGTIIQLNHLKIRSPGQGLSPLFIEKLVGKALRRDIEDEGYFYPSDLEIETKHAREYSVKMRWGVPVRYHDFEDYIEQSNLDLVEFHLSYSDMELNISDYLTGNYNCGFVVHAPELFKDSLLMDLASDDEVTLSSSIQETQRVINLTRDLKSYFPSEKCPLIVANIGGFSMDQPFSEKKKAIAYERFAESLNKLDLNGVELIPQTMAPFPWHFGGQRHQNLFVLHDEIAEWGSKLNLRFCFDVSHSKLACNHFKIDFDSFVQTVAPMTAHLHLGDAKGVNGEGLQIGEGAIDFKSLGKAISKLCPSASFIPEIWQGHKDGGRGFWLAMEKLEEYF